MTRDDWPDGADWRLPYMTWPLPMDEDAAAAEFKARHGYPPEFVFAASDCGGLLRAGPVQPCS